MESLRNLSFYDNNTSSLETKTDPEWIEWYIANCVVNILLAIAAILENLFILIAIWRTSTLHTPSYVFLFCLALSDLAVGLLAQPLVVIHNVAEIQGTVSMARVTSVAAAMLSTYLCSVSILSITAVSIDRYLALYLHLRYKQLVTNKRVVALLICTWLFAALVFVTWLWYPANLLIGVAIGICCIIIITFCFCRIYFILRHHHQQIRSQPRPNNSSTEISKKALTSTHYRRSVMGMLMVCVFLLLCYVPYLCTACVIVVRGLTNTNRLLFEFTRTVVFANSAMNPLIYCWRLRDIRTAVLQHLPAWFG